MTSSSPPAGNSRCRIVLTGGPGGGKTTAADLFRREMGDRVVLVPESATMLFSGGFPRPNEGQAIRYVQDAIFHVQRNLEDLTAARYPNHVLLCDRGTLDGAAYWPAGDGDFFDWAGTTQDAELARYDAVIFFETAAVGGLSVIGPSNPTRIENTEQAIDVDRRLHRLWAKHPRFLFVPHNPSFFKKITFALASLEGMVEQLARRLRGDDDLA